MNKSLLAAVASLVAMAFYAMPAAAQATRTWVSGVGDDANPCSRTAPCKTFAGAISKTAAGGIINCLDPGGYGAVTITKAMTIDCVGTQGSALSSGVQGIIVNAAASDKVILRHLDINGAGTTLGTNGVAVLGAASVQIDQCRISNYSNAGIRVAVSANPVEVHVKDTIISDSGSGATSGGIVMNSTGVLARLILSRVELRNNTTGIVGITGGAGITGTNVVIAGSSGDGVRLQASSGSSSAVFDQSFITGNAGNGIFVDSNTQVLLGRSTVADNGVGLAHVGTGALYTYGTNQINANGSSSAFTNSLSMQ
jgi:hypothetical protein